MKTYVITLNMASDLREHEVEELIVELLTDAREHLLAGEALTLQSVALAE